MGGQVFDKYVRDAVGIADHQVGGVAIKGDDDVPAAVHRHRRVIRITIALVAAAVAADQGGDVGGQVLDKYVSGVVGIADHQVGGVACKGNDEVAADVHRHRGVVRITIAL